MAIGAFNAFTATIASGGSTSPVIDLGRGYSKVIFDITGAGEACMFYAATTVAGTYRLVRHPVLSGMSAPQTCTVGTACSGSLVEVTPLQGLRYIKVSTSGTVANGGSAKIYCCDV